MKNYVKIDKGLFRDLYAFIDTPKHFADQLFIKHKVRVYFQRGEMARPGDRYVVIFCKVRKKDTCRFITALNELPNKMLLLGYDDYAACCEEVMRIVERSKEG